MKSLKNIFRHPGNVIDASRDKASQSPQWKPLSGFTIIEIVCTLAIISLFMGGILKTYNIFQERNKQIQTHTELCKIASMIEEYRDLYGDYPKIETHSDDQGAILCSALHGNIDPDGNVLDATVKVDLVATTLKEIDGKFVDPFSSDYIYYYKLRSDCGIWENPSFILLSKGPKGQQNPKRNASVSKSVTIGVEGRISGNLCGDIIITNGGFL